MYCGSLGGGVNGAGNMVSCFWRALRQTKVFTWKTYNE
jgi:hypothetical protein